MGMWVDDQRHGSGVLVTLDGMYFEGNFVQNKLQVGYTDNFMPLCKASCHPELLCPISYKIVKETGEYNAGVTWFVFFFFS